jgi:hypothetical protein
VLMVWHSMGTGQSWCAFSLRARWRDFESFRVLLAPGPARPCRSGRDTSATLHLKLCDGQVGAVAAWGTCCPLFGRKGFCVVKRLLGGRLILQNMQALHSDVWRNGESVGQLKVSCTCVFENVFLQASIFKQQQRLSADGNRAALNAALQ